MAFTAAQAVSWLFILVVCIRSGYINATTDAVLALIIWSAIIMAYAFPTSPGSLLAAFIQGGAVGGMILLLLFLAFRKLGLPSPPRAIAPAAIV